MAVTSVIADIQALEFLRRQQVCFPDGQSSVAGSDYQPATFKRVEIPHAAYPSDA
ncbi:hypothetical protein PMI06_008773 [Burkholderia sp. BT03]|nr:hypothetical protein PMI06_008773 [Burkholderia sp. BT03]SKC52537.1 hypothetical protein SAMN06266956_0515 [Paraburkholderia hospita]